MLVTRATHDEDSTLSAASIVSLNREKFVVLLLCWRKTVFPSWVKGKMKVDVRPSKCATLIISVSWILYKSRTSLKVHRPSLSHEYASAYSNDPLVVEIWMIGRLWCSLCSFCNVYNAARVPDYLRAPARLIFSMRSVRRPWLSISTMEGVHGAQELLHPT